jgi:mannose-6-phosphate isomerase-like protein (cupin superfamily)
MPKKSILSAIARQTLIAGMVLLTSQIIPAQAQTKDAPLAKGRPAPGNMPGSFVFIPKADLEALMGPTRGDRPARVVSIGGGADLGAFILHYPPMKNTVPNSFYHSEISELYYVIRGEGTALLGGELKNPKWNDPDSPASKVITGPTVSGTMTNYKTQKWSAGDVIIVPAGVPHMIGWEVTVANDILRVVLDPKKAITPVPTREASMALVRAEGQAQGQAQASTAAVKPAPPNIPGTTFTYIPKADLEALMNGNIADRPARLVNIPGNANFGAFVLHMEPRKPAAAPVTSFYHSEISELYYFIRGSGTAMMAGELENATWDDSNSASIRTVRGPSVNGTMKNAVAQKFSAGDILIVSPGVPHAVTYEVDERTDIIRAVIDHKRLLELK